MTAIAEALVATAAGIAVAIPAVVAFNYLQRKVSAILAGTDVLSNLVLAYLSREVEVPVKRPLPSAPPPARAGEEI
jgi:biopolymer transport protein ExbB/TolQ